MVDGRKSSERESGMVTAVRKGNWSGRSFGAAEDGRTTLKEGELAGGERGKMTGDEGTTSSRQQGRVRFGKLKS